MHMLSRLMLWDANYIFHVNESEILPRNRQGNKVMTHHKTGRRQANHYHHIQGGMEREPNMAGLTSSEDHNSRSKCLCSSVGEKKNHKKKPTRGNKLKNNNF